MSNIDARVQAFMREELELFARELYEDTHRQLTRRRIMVNEDLLRSLATEVVSSTEARQLFARHGRFHDMGARPGWHKGRFIGREARTELHRKPKPSKWYSRPKWGQIGQLVTNLSNKYVDTVADQAREALTHER